MAYQADGTEESALANISDMQMFSCVYSQALKTAYQVGYITKNQESVILYHFKVRSNCFIFDFTAYLAFSECCS